MLNRESAVQIVTQQLGRSPRGFEEVAVWSNEARPVVIRVASVVDEKPFPTLFWLVDEKINYALDRLESVGVIKKLQEVVDRDPELQQRLILNHRDYIQLRNSYLQPEVEHFLKEKGYFEALQKKGIGGIADFSRIRCLHTYYAAHLVLPNIIGELIESQWLNVEKS